VLLLPLLLIVGLVFVVATGGFIIVLIGVYYLCLAAAGLLGSLAFARRARTRSARAARRARSSQAARSASRQPAPAQLRAAGVTRRSG
jgi:hypothetical protein